MSPTSHRKIKTVSAASLKFMHHSTSDENNIFASRYLCVERPRCSTRPRSPIRVDSIRVLIVNNPSMHVSVPHSSSRQLVVVAVARVCDALRFVRARLPFLISLHDRAHHVQFVRNARLCFDIVIFRNDHARVTVLIQFIRSPTDRVAYRKYIRSRLCIVNTNCRRDTEEPRHSDCVRRSRISLRPGLHPKRYRLRCPLAERTCRSPHRVPRA